MPKNNKKITKFISKLLEILQDSKYEQIIRWNKDGTGVQIKDRKQLQEKVLHQNFKLKKVASFIRQLHLYGFHKSKSSGKENSFKHPLFINNQQTDYSVIKRKPKSKQSQTPKKSQQSFTQDNSKPPQQLSLPQLCSINSLNFLPKYCQSVNNSMANIFSQWFLKNEDQNSLNLDDCMK